MTWLQITRVLSLTCMPYCLLSFFDCTLQAQAARFLAESEAALEAVRREAGQAASAVMESVMEGVREEVAAVQVRARVAGLEAQQEPGRTLGNHQGLDNGAACLQCL